MAKRIFDILLSLLALTLTSPLILLSAISVVIGMGNPILFIQQRPGYLGRPFTLYKFRTMREVLSVNGCQFSDHDRITFVGKILRKTSLDELPQLFNVLRGDMSLVGPRPLLMEYLTLYNDHQKKRHDALPGITGWAQVNGRNAISWQEKFNLDVWYVENQSFWLDITILWMTIKKVMVREGISADGEATMPKFTGNKEQ